jgi:hypothetical protein
MVNQTLYTQFITIQVFNPQILLRRPIYRRKGGIERALVWI